MKTSHTRSTSEVAPSATDMMAQGYENNIQHFAEARQFAKAARACEKTNQPRRAFEFYAEEALFRDAHAKNTLTRTDNQPVVNVKRLTALTDIRDDYIASLAARDAQRRLLPLATDLADFATVEHNIDTATIATIRRLINTYAAIFETKSILLSAAKSRYSNDPTGLLIQNHEENAARTLGGYINQADALYSQAIALCGDDNALREEIEKERRDFAKTYYVPQSVLH